MRGVMALCRSRSRPEAGTFLGRPVGGLATPFCFGLGGPLQLNLALGFQWVRR